MQHGLAKLRGLSPQLLGAARNRNLPLPILTALSLLYVWLTTTCFRPKCLSMTRWQSISMRETSRKVIHRRIRHRKSLRFITSTVKALRQSIRSNSPSAARSIYKDYRYPHASCIPSAPGVFAVNTVQVTAAIMPVPAISTSLTNRSVTLLWTYAAETSQAANSGSGKTTSFPSAVSLAHLYFGHDHETKDYR